MGRQKDLHDELVQDKDVKLERLAGKFLKADDEIREAKTRRATAFEAIQVHMKNKNLEVYRRDGYDIVIRQSRKLTVKRAEQPDEQPDNVRDISDAASGPGGAHL